MEINALASTYVNYVKQSKYNELFNELYADHAESIEATEGPGGPRITRGLEALRHKSRGFDEVHQVHGQTISDPWPHGEDKFAVHMTFDMTHLPSGHRREMDEIAVITVNEGKIIREEFFYRSQS